jgi:hypothetical protein
MSKQTLYYSKRCRYSQAFLEELAGTPYVPEFIFVCVDPTPKGTRPPLPGWLKSVPTLLVAGEATPRVGPGPVNNWLFERKMGSVDVKTAKNTVEDRPALAAPVYSPDVSSKRPDVSAMMGAGTGTGSSSGAAAGSAGRAAPVPSGPEAYHGAEMAGGKWSDAYSFVGDAFTAEKGFDPISRNFQSLVEGFAGGATPGSAGSAGSAAAAPKQTAKEAALLKEYEAFPKSREMDISGPPKRI